ncbi:hypothetical protein SUGI_0819380 [Cryptomeria japonica]|uniref:uncharacterized protein LOC131078985 n=1 Tax=Cryptomeria japonica TaxID=3369 RepID=UPI002414CD18|nr:uncharacterized protein LOC131078985 [Cryptomeria japonica]GLJ40029.1 hypothetical protein SUGI_0819380 [Cryptomeria japonica]
MKDQNLEFFYSLLQTQKTTMQMDIELLYAQVIAEAKIYAQMSRDEKGGGGGGNEDFRRLGRSRSTYITSHCFSPPKMRRSWKNYLLSWRLNKSKRSADNSNSNSNFKQRHSKVSHSAPLTTTNLQKEDSNEIFISSSGFSWWRKRGGSYVAGVRSPLSPMTKTKVGCGGGFQLDSDFPYARLSTHSTSRFHREIEPPLQLVVEDW